MKHSMMNARTLVSALLAFVLGAGLGWLLGPKASISEVTRDAVGAERESGEDPILPQLRRIEAALQDLKTERAADTPATSGHLAEPNSSGTESGGRTPVGPDPALTRIQEELVSLRRALESLREAIAAGRFPPKFPSLEMIRSARSTQNWPSLDKMFELALLGDKASHDVMMESVRWKSQEDVLAEFGLPSRIHSNGMWEYRKERRKLYFEFVEDYVANVAIQGE